MIATYKRELRALLLSPMGSVLVVGFVLAMVLLGLYVMPPAGSDWFLAKELTMVSFFRAFPWVAAVILPAVSMRTWSEDLGSGTYQLLSTLPQSLLRVQLGKFAACKTFLFVMLAMTAIYPAMVISAAGETVAGVEFGPMIAGYLGCMLLGSAFLAIGMFVSALTTQQIVAYIATLLICGGLVAWSNFAGLAATSGGGWFTGVLVYLSVELHFANLARGNLTLDAVVWFLSIGVGFLALNYFWLEWRRFR